MGDLVEAYLRENPNAIKREFRDRSKERPQRREADPADYEVQEGVGWTILAWAYLLVMGIGQLLVWAWSALIAIVVVVGAVSWVGFGGWFVFKLATETTWRDWAFIPEGLATAAGFYLGPTIMFFGFVILLAPFALLVAFFRK